MLKASVSVNSFMSLLMLTVSSLSTTSADFSTLSSLPPLLLAGAFYLLNLFCPVAVLTSFTFLPASCLSERPRDFYFCRSNDELFLSFERLTLD